jgi:hypothetical protein
MSRPKYEKYDLTPLTRVQQNIIRRTLRDNRLVRKIRTKTEQMSYKYLPPWTFV